MDTLPEIKVLNEVEDIEDDINEDNGLEIQLIEEENDAIFEKPVVAPKKRGRKKKEVVIVDPPEEEVEIEVEENIDDIEIPTPKAKTLRTYKDLVWLNEIFSPGKDNNWLSTKRIKLLLERYSKEHGTLTFPKFTQWIKWRFGSVSTKRGNQFGMNRVNIARKEDLLFVLSSEGEEFAEPVNKVQPKSFDFNEFKSYMNAYEQEKQQAEKDKEIERLKREKEELELEKKYYDKFRRQQMLERQNATNALPQVQSNHIDWSKYRGL